MLMSYRYCGLCICKSGNRKHGMEQQNGLSQETVKHGMDQQSGLIQ